MFYTMMSTLAPYLMEVLGLIITALIGMVAARFQQWSGIQIDARHREALHKALMTAAQAAVGRHMSGAVAVDFVEEYVGQSVPDALRRLKPSAGVLVELARAKLAEAAK